MPTASPPTETKTRRFTALDCVVVALVVGSFAAPFAAHMQVEAQAAAPQVAIRAEVSPIRSIDIALGYEEERAEAAFFEGLSEDYKSSADIALDVALAEPVYVPVVDIPEPKRVEEIKVIPALVSDADAERGSALISDVDDGPEQPIASEVLIGLVDGVVEPIKAAVPMPLVDIAIISMPLLLDRAIAADVSDEPPAPKPKPEPEPEVAEEGDEAEPQIKVTMTAPPTMTPFPIKRPFHEVTTPIKTVALAAPRLQLPTGVTPQSNLQLPIDVTPIAPSFIEETALPPLEVVTTPIREEVRTVPLSVPVEIVETPIPPAPVEQVETVVAVAQPLPPTPARPAARIRTGPRIALVITAAGLNESVTRFAIDALPAGVTLAFAPVRAEAAALAREAKADGHMVLVEIPLEPVNKNRDPGPMTLRVADSPRKNLDRLDRVLARIPVADGASTYLGTRFNTDERAAGSMVEALSQRNLFLFENEPSSRSVFRRLSARTKLPYARSTLKIDRNQNSAAIRAALDGLEKQARERGVAVGVGTALRGTISTVALWAKQAEKRGVRLVPIFEVVR